MFFWLVCRECGDAPVDWNRWVDALDNLGESGFKGDHLVLGDRPVLDQVRNIAGLSRKAKAYFESAYARLTTIGAVSNAVRPIQVDPTVLAEVEVAGYTVIPLSHFVPQNSAERSLLLCEHMYDFTVAVEFGFARMKALGLSAVCRLSFRPASGGGGGIHLTLSTYQTDPLSIGLCLVDSDRAHPFDRLGASARTCKQAHEPGWKWTLHITEARELENLIPPELADAAGFAQMRLGDYYCEECWAIGGYVDHKTADVLCRFVNMDASNLSYSVVRAAVAQFQHRSERSKECCANCECVAQRACPLNTVHGNLLSRLANWLSPAGSIGRVGALTTVPAFDSLADRVILAGLAPAFALS
jgi:hypothetical protein